MVDVVRRMRGDVRCIEAQLGALALVQSLHALHRETVPVWHDRQWCTLWGERRGLRRVIQWLTNG